MALGPARLALPRAANVARARAVTVSPVGVARAGRVGGTGLRPYNGRLGVETVDGGAATVGLDRVGAAPARTGPRTVTWPPTPVDVVFCVGPAVVGPVDEVANRRGAGETVGPDVGVAGLAAAQAIGPRPYVGRLEELTPGGVPVDAAAPVGPTVRRTGAAPVRRRPTLDEVGRHGGPVRE